MHHTKRLISLLLTAVLLAVLSIPCFAATLKTSSAEAVFRIINAERKDAGLHTLQWDADLVDAAQIRAKEIVTKYTTDHTRPDGTKYLSVSTKVWGENTAYGQWSASEVMESWMASKGHRENLLRESYTIVGVACAEGKDGLLYWVQLFGNGKSNTSWANIKAYTLDPFANGGNTAQASADVVSVALMDSEGAVSAQGLAALVKSADSSTITVQNAKSISPEAFQAAVNTAQNNNLSIRATTTAADGNAVQGSLLLEPSKLTGRKSAIRTGVYTDSRSVATVKTLAEKYFTNDNVAYVHMDHSGALTVRTQVTARVNLDSLDSTRLRIYMYDKQEKRFTLLENTEAAYESGVVTFYTKYAGDLIIADAKLI